MISEPFATGNSLVHRLDPRVKVLTAAFYSFTVALSAGFPVLLSAVLLSLVLITLARLNLKEIVRRLIVVNGLIFMLWVVLPLTFEGRVWMTLGPLVIYRPGIMLSAQITLKANAILMALIAMVSTVPFSTLGHALHQLRVPSKMVHLLLMTYRYIFVIEQEYQRLLRAAKIRGFQAGTNLNTYRTFAYVVGMLFVRAANRADRVYQAMICRGFKGKFYTLQTFHMNAVSWAFSAVMLAMIIGMIAAEWL